MLYNLHDIKNQAMEPVRYISQLTKIAYSNPFNPLSYTSFGKVMVANSNLLENILRKRNKPEWNINDVNIDGKSHAVSINIVKDLPFCNLIHFKRDYPKAKNDPKILLVAPMSGHYATLLRGTVEALIKDHEVYVTDWKDAATVPIEKGRFGLDEYIDYMLDFMRDLAPNLNVIAVCQPAPLVLSAVSLLAQKNDKAEPDSMILMGGPVDTTAAPTVVTAAAEKQSLNWFENNCIHLVPSRFIGKNRKVYPGFLQLRAFMSMNPTRHADAHAKLYTHLIEGDGDSVVAHDRFYDEYLAVMDVTSEFYLETIKEIFQQHAIPNGTMNWRGEMITPASIKKCALMTVEGELDDISAPGQTIATHDLCPNIPKGKHLNLVQKNVGHYGIFNGRHWRDTIKPAIGKFIRANAVKD